MSRILFIIFLLSASGVDRHLAAGIVCVCAVAALMRMST